MVLYYVSYYYVCVLYYIVGDIMPLFMYLSLFVLTILVYIFVYVTKVVFINSASNALFVRRILVCSNKEIGVF